MRNLCIVERPPPRMALKSIFEEKMISWSTERCRPLKGVLERLRGNGVNCYILLGWRILFLTVSFTIYYKIL